MKIIAALVLLSILCVSCGYWEPMIPVENQPLPVKGTWFSQSPNLEVLELDHGWLVVIHGLKLTFVPKPGGSGM